jgi:lipopolysaccharide export system protein LptC
MAARDNLHSHLVAWLKVILPLSALALLSSLFLMARTRTPEGELPFSKRDLAEMAARQQIDNPDFSSVTDDGHIIHVIARTAVPRDDETDLIDTTMLEGTLDTLAGDTFWVTANDGTLHPSTSVVDLSGNVRITSSTGYTLETEQMTADLEANFMETFAPARIQGPLGSIESQRATIQSAPDDTNALTAVFKGDVKLIYLPQNE